MTFQDLVTLSPLLTVAVGTVLLMLAIAFFRSHRLALAVTLVTLALALAAAVALRVPTEPLALTPLLVYDAYSQVLWVLMLGAGLAVAPLLHGYLEGWPDQPEEAYLLVLLALLGALVLAAANHAAAFLLGLELLSVALFGAIAYTRTQRRPLEAGIKYLVLSAYSSAILLFGLALLYAATGTLVFSELPQRIGAVDSDAAPLLAIGGVMIWAGVAFKLSLVPFHLWTADVYEGAPAPVSGLLATVSKGAVAAVLLRYLSEAPADDALRDALTVVAVATMLAGNLLALLSNQVKRVLAYSSIAHFGYLLVPFVVGGSLAGEAVLFYLVAYFVTTLGAFGVVTQLSSPFRGADLDRVEDYRGLFWRHPFLASTFAATLLSLAGIPLTAGFLAKVYVIAAGVETRAWLLVGAVVLGSAIGLYYYLRLTIVLFLPAPETSAARPAPATVGPLRGLLLSALFALLFWFGTFPADLLDWIRPAAVALE